MAIKFHAPSFQGASEPEPANAPGLRHVSFTVDEIDAMVGDLQTRGVELVGEVVTFEDTYRLCYLRGPEGIIVELAQRVG